MAHSGKTMTFATDLVPQEDNIYSLGTDSLKWIIRGSLPLSDITGADDLKAIEAISGTTGLLKKTAANTWTLDTNTYLTAHRTYTAFTGKPTGNQTPGFGSTFTIQQISQSTTGQVSGTDRTVTIPSTAANATTAGLVNTDAQTFAGVKTFDNGIHVYGTISTQGTGSTAGTMYPGGAYHSGHNSIILHGDTAGISGIGFTSEKATKSGTTTNINSSSDRAFIQYHAYGVTPAAEGTAPTLATSGELGALVIGVGNDATDTIRLQAPGTAGILHQIGATAYPIPHTINTNGSVGGTTTPVYVEAGVIKAGTALGTASQKAESYFVKAITSTDEAIVRFSGTAGQVQDSKVTINDNGTITLPTEQDIDFRMNRKTADGGGWAHGYLNWYDKANNIFAVMGLYGINDALDYIYIGSNTTYSSDVNLQIYANGTIKGKLFSGSGASLTSLNASNLSSGTVPVACLPLATTSAAGVVKIGSGISVSDGTISVTAANLGLSNAMHFIGIATKAISDGGTEDPTISGYSTKTAGDVIIDKDTRREYVWSTAGKWEMLGFDASAKYEKTTSGNTFISKITQATDGTVTAESRALDTSGTWSGKATTSGTADKIKNLTTTDQASSSNDWRRVWISYANKIEGRPAYTDNLVYQTSSNTLKTPHLLIEHVSGDQAEMHIKYSTTIDYWWGVGTANENHGLYDVKAGKWILSAGSANTWSFVGNADTATTATNLSAAPTITSGGTSTVDLSANTAYTLTVGGKTVVFKTPADNNTATATDDILDGSNSGTAITYKPYTTQQNKLSFDTSTTDPTLTGRLNLNGYLHATKLYSGSNEVLTIQTKSKSLSTAGWYRILDCTAYSMTFFITFYGGYNNQPPTPVTFLVSHAYNTTRIEQIGRSGYIGWIQQLRAVHHDTSKFYIDVYYAGNKGNTCAFEITPLDPNARSNTTLIDFTVITDSITANASCETTLESHADIAGTATSAGKWTTARNISISDSDGTNTGTAVSVDGSEAVTLKLPATIKASLIGNADTATSLTNFVISSYTISGGKGVRIKYPSYAPVLISCQRSNSGGRLILIGGGYGEQGTVRNDFTELVSPNESSFTWSMPEPTGYACTIEIMNHNSSGTATVWVESTAACTFTEITALTSTKTNRRLLHSSNYTDYTVTKTGSGASGTWDISITGSAGSVAWDNVSDHPTNLNQFTNGPGYVTSSGVTSVKLIQGAGITVSSSGTAITTTGERTISITGMDTTNGSTTKWLDQKGNWSTPTAANVGALASTTKYAASSSVGGAATNATTTANTSDSIYPVGVKSGATTTLLHDTSITMKGNAITAVTYNSTAASLTSETSTTANTAKYATLTLGNNANVSTTTAHSEGQIVMYSAATQAHTIKGTSTTTAYTHTLPNDTGLLVSLSGGTAKGSSTKPVYIPNTGIVTECSTYAGGTKVTFNGADKGASTASFYAPTSGGTVGNVLISAGTSAPAWYGGAVMTGTAAADWKTAFNGTTDATASDAAAVTIAGGLGIAKSIVVGDTATITNNIRSPIFTLTADDADKAYLQYNTTDDSIDFIFM